MICSKESCTGCAACLNICPKNAVEMKEDEWGFLYPCVDENKCINCNLCKKACPAINDIQYNDIINIYAGKSNSHSAKNSTSGGIATTISYKFIEEKGIVYGVAFNSNMSAEHVKITDSKELWRLQGSKYVQSSIKNIFRDVKNELENEKKVLFIGTSCQIAGLKKYLIKDYKNLYTIDLICHGVPSQKYLKDEINNLNINFPIRNIKFRNGEKYELTIIGENESVKYKRDESSFIDSFLLRFTIRDNCFRCKYRKLERISDITLGDFWGLPEKSKFYNKKDDGVSLIITSSEKGEELLVNSAELIEKESMNDVDVSKNLKVGFVEGQTKENKNFKKYYLKHGFYCAYIKANKFNIIRKKIKSNKFIYNLYKKIKKG